MTKLITFRFPSIALSRFRPAASPSPQAWTAKLFWRVFEGRAKMNRREDNRFPPHAFPLEETERWGARVAAAAKTRDKPSRSGDGHTYRLQRLRKNLEG